jgi:triosephosphate isomerase
MKFSPLSFLALVGSASAFAPTFGVPRSTSLEATRKPFITGNWKLNPQTQAEAIDLARGIAAAITDDSPCDAALFVPFTFIEAVKGVLGDKLLVGAEVGRILLFT